MKERAKDRTQKVVIEQKERNNDVRIVRKTYEGGRLLAVNSYDRAKNINGLVKYGFESGETLVSHFDWVYNPIFTRVGKVGEPLIDNADDRLEMYTKQMNENIVEPVTERFHQLQQAAQDQIIIPVQERVIIPVQENVITPVQQRVIIPVQEQVIYPVVTTARERVIEPLRAIPGKAEHQWKSLRGDLSKKTAARLEDGLTRVRHFSAHQLKSLIHVDLIEYSEELYDQRGKPAAVEVHRRLTEANDRLQAQVAAARELVSTRTSEATTELQRRLQAAIATARDLAHQGHDFIVSHANMESIRQMPSESVQFIMQAKRYFQGEGSDAEGNAGVDAGMLDYMTHLISAVKDVTVSSFGKVKTVEEEVEIEGRENGIRAQEGGALASAK